MTLKTKVANALSFAQMAGLGRSKAAKAEDDEDKKKDEAKAEDDESEEAKAKAEADDEEKDDKKESKKAKAEDEDDDEDEEGEKKEKAKASAERARCKAIVAHGVKTGQVVHACAYAFDTGMSAQAAIATLDANLQLQPSRPNASGLAERMASVKTPVVMPEGDAPEAGSAAAVAAMVIAAAAKARGEKA